VSNLPYSLPAFHNVTFNATVPNTSNRTIHILDLHYMLDEQTGSTDVLRLFISSTDVWPFCVTLLLSFVMHCNLHPQAGNILHIINVANIPSFLS